MFCAKQKTKIILASDGDIEKFRFCLKYSLIPIDIEIIVYIKDFVITKADKDEEMRSIRWEQRGERDKV